MGLSLGPIVRAADQLAPVLFLTRAAPAPRKKPRAEQERGSARRKDTEEERKGERSGTQAPAAGRHTVLICQLAVSDFLPPTDPTDTPRR